MGLSKFKSQILFLDTALLIYFIEGRAAYQANLKRLFAAFDKGNFSILTSTLTILEVLVQPLKVNRQDLVDQYRQILSPASGIEIIEMTSANAYRAAELKAKYAVAKALGDIPPGLLPPLFPRVFAAFKLTLILSLIIHIGILQELHRLN